jgi:hypothetical protein
VAGPGSNRQQWRAVVAQRLRTIAPHALTALCAVAVSALVTSLTITPEAVTAPTVITVIVGAPTVHPTAIPRPSDTAEPAVAAGISRQELLDLRAEDDAIWAALYLVRAISHADDADAALRVNALAEVDQALIAVDDALSLARSRAVGAARDPIDQLRRDVGTMREDMYLRPEALDGRIGRLRQAMLTLIGHGP